MLAKLYVKLFPVCRRIIPVRQITNQSYTEKKLIWLFFHRIFHLFLFFKIIYLYIWEIARRFVDSLKSF